MQAQGGGANVLGSPMQAVAEVMASANDLPGREPIEAGEILTTGTLTAAHPVQAGETWNTEPADIGLDPVRVQISM